MFADNDSSLLIIHSKEEQEFISQFVFKTNKIVENVWLGLKKNNNDLKWSDGSNLDSNQINEFNQNFETNEKMQQQINRCFLYKILYKTKIMFHLNSMFFQISKMRNKLHLIPSKLIFEKVLIWELKVKQFLNANQTMF
jgi:hypothetical protein